MKTIINYFFVTLGVIFFILILAVLYVWYSDMWSIRTYATFMQSRTQSAPATDDGGRAEQQQALEAAGLDMGMFDTLTAEQETCFVDRLGAERVAEISAGAMPTMGEIAAGSDCL